VTARRAALATTTFLIALYAASPWLAEHLLPPLLARWGIEDARLSIGYPTLRGLDVARFALRANRVTVEGGATRIDWTLASLLRGDLESIVVDELGVRVASGARRDGPPAQYELPAFWALTPARRVRIEHLTVANDEPRIDAAGRVTFDPDVLQAALHVESPLLAVPLDVEGSVDPDGHLTIAVDERGVAEPLASLSGTIDRAARTLAFNGSGRLSGRPLQLLAAYAGVRSIAGSIEWRLDGRAPWPLPADGSTRGVDADVRYRIDVADVVGAFGTARATIHGDAAVANGAVKGRVESGSSVGIESAALAALAAFAPRGGVGGTVAVDAEQDVELEFAAQRLRIGDGLALTLQASDKPIRLHARGALGLDRSFDLSMVGLDGAPVLLATGSPEGDALAVKSQLVLTGRPLRAVAQAAGIVATHGHVAVDFEGRVGDGARSPYDVDGRGRARVALTGKFGDDAFDASFEGGYSVGAAIDATIDPAAHVALTNAGIEASTVGPIVATATMDPLSIDVGAIDCRIALPPVHVGERTVTLGNAWISVDSVKLAGSTLTTSATLRTHVGRDAWPLRVTASHDLDSAVGSFASNGEWQAQKAALRVELPGFDAPYDIDDGTVALQLDGGWKIAKANTYWAKGRLRVNAHHAHYDDYAIEGVAADLPLEVATESFAVGANAVAIDSIDVGFPVTNVAVDFDVANGAAHVRRLTGTTLGGRFEAAPFDYDLTYDKMSVALDLNGISLADVLALEGGDVHGDGVLDGRLPLALDGSTFTIVDGRVAARAPGGTLVYKGAAAASLAEKSGLAFALQALEDFRYDTLDAKVALAADGVLALGVRLQGMNPAVEQGRAIQFNLNVTENLPALLQSLRAADRITEKVEKRFVQ
jgi:hypothetical protein